MPLKIVRNDITRMQVDAIVNTANTEPIYSSGVDMAVYKAAGEKELLAEREKIGCLEEGEVAITSGYNLPAKYIIHAVSPYYEDGAHGEEELLRSCYKKSLEMAQAYCCKSVAFPLISTGSFGYPREEGMRIAIDEINGFLLHHSMLVYLVVFDEASTRLGTQLYPELEAYIDRNYVEIKSREEYGAYRPHPLAAARPATEVPEMVDSEKQRLEVPSPANREKQRPEVPILAKKEPKRPNIATKFLQSMRVEPKESSEELREEFYCDALEEADYCDFLEENESALQERMKHISDTFQEYLLYLIEERGLSNAEVYKRAIITKQLFSKIKLNPQYHPDKGTAMRLCVGAKLSLDETKDLLARAGYALSPCDKRDIIFSFFIEHGVFDMIEIDIALEEHGLPCFIE